MIVDKYQQEMLDRPSSGRLKVISKEFEDCMPRRSMIQRRQSMKTGKPRINKGSDADVLYLEKIIQTSFFGLVELIRKRLSFYGVYKAHDSIDLVLLKINLARKRLRRIKEQMYQS